MIHNHVISAYCTKNKPSRVAKNCRRVSPKFLKRCNFYLKGSSDRIRMRIHQASVRHTVHHPALKHICNNNVTVTL